MHDQVSSVGTSALNMACDWQTANFAAMCFMNAAANMGHAHCAVCEQCLKPGSSVRIQFRDKTTSVILPV